MEISSQRHNGILIVCPKGRLDSQGAAILDAFLAETITESDRTAVFDMIHVSYLSSAGIRTILATDKKLRSRKGLLHLSGIQPNPLSVLEMTGFLSVFAIHPDCEGATRAASAGLPYAAIGTACDDVATFCENGAEYTVTRRGKGGSELLIVGYPAEGQVLCQDEETAVPVTVPVATSSMGLGGPGHQPCEMGDLLTIGNIVAWNPPASGGNPDYLVIDPKRSEIPVSAAFLLYPTNPADLFVEMRSKLPEGIRLSDLFEALSGIASRMEPEYRGVLFISFCAESPDFALLAEGAQKELLSPPAMLAGCAVIHDPGVRPAYFRGVAPDLLYRRVPGHPGVVPRVMSLVFHDLPAGKFGRDTLERALSSGVPALLGHLPVSTRISRAMLEISMISEIVTNTGTEIIMEEGVSGWNRDLERIVHILHHDCSEVRLSQISGGYSGSLVFRDDAYDRRGRREMPFVLKMDRWENIEAEIRGYEGHVKRYIQNNATQVIQAERSGDYGGILYTFVGIRGPQSRIFSLEDYYLSHPAGEVQETFDLLFRKVLGAWYGQPRLRYLPLYRVYADIYNYEGVRDWAESRYGMTPGDRMIDLPHGMGESINPLYFMEKVVPDRLLADWNVYEGSVHGDLNMKNVLMDEERNMWLIDFAMTGHSHILRDIAKLESVIKLEMIPVSSADRLLRLLELEKILLSQQRLGAVPETPSVDDEDIAKAFSVIRQLRGYADTVTLLDDDIRQYNLALLYYTLPVPAYVSVNDKAKEYAWISSSLICNTLI